MPAWLIVLLCAIAAVAFFVVGMSLTLMIKGHHIDSEISTNKDMQRLGIKCAVQETREADGSAECGTSPAARHLPDCPTPPRPPGTSPTARSLPDRPTPPRPPGTSPTARHLPDYPAPPRLPDPSRPPDTVLRPTKNPGIRIGRRDL